MTATRSPELYDAASVLALEARLHAIQRQRIKLLKPLKNLEAEEERLVEYGAPASERMALRRQRPQYVMPLLELNAEYDLVQRQLEEARQSTCDGRPVEVDR